MKEKILFYDTETTGLIARHHGIHQISGALRIDGKVVETFNYKMCPPEGTAIDPKALAVSGLTESQIQKYSHNSFAYRDFAGLLNRYVDRYNKKDKIILCGYNNAAFDNEFLRAWFEKSFDPYFGSYFWGDTLDARVLAMQYLKSIRHTMENFKQSTVARTLGIEVDESKLHDAEYDLEILMKIYDMVAFYDTLI